LKYQKLRKSRQLSKKENYDEFEEDNHVEVKILLTNYFFENPLHLFKTCFLLSLHFCQKN
jgi:hypothetical protein